MTAPTQPPHGDAELMIVEIPIVLPVDVTAVAKLPRALEQAIRRIGLTHLPITVRGRTDD